jgi:hypothetical protein
MMANMLVRFLYDFVCLHSRVPEHFNGLTDLLGHFSERRVLGNYHLQCDPQRRYQENC